MNQQPEKSREEKIRDRRRSNERRGGYDNDEAKRSAGY